MSLQGALSTAVTGLRASQVGVDLVARNLANADTPGYTKKSQLPSAQYTNGQVIGVNAGIVQREVDSFVQQQLRTEIGIGSHVDIRTEYLTRIDQLFGAPGQSNALDTILNQFGQSLSGLIATPDSFGARQLVVTDATTIAQQLNRLSTEIQQMRQQTELALSDAVDAANTAMREIARLNVEIQTIYDTSPGVADLEDARDRYIDQLSTLMDIQVAEGTRGAVRVYTGGGNLLVDQQAATFAFDARTLMDASAQYSQDDAERGVGTITMVSLGGTTLDLFKHGTFNSGEIAAYKELRDVTLVQAQAQLDEIAHGLALALSSTTVPGTAVSVGAQDGFTLDVADLMAGNEMSVTYTRTPPGTQQTVTFVRVDDADSLPLSNDFTARANDTVVGIDFSNGLAAAAAAIDQALGAGFTVTSPAADTIRFLDDGAPGAVSIDAVSALVTPGDLQGGTLGAALFVDLDGTYKTYSNSPDGDGQKLGFAGRITFNQAIAADNSLLVQYDATTGSADPARPQALYDRFSNTPFVFSASTGIGGVKTPFTGTIGSFAQRVINFQAQQTAEAQRSQEAQTIVIDALQTRFDKDTKVNVDEELSRLLEFQNSYAANARVMSVIKELLDILMHV